MNYSEFREEIFKALQKIASKEIVLQAVEVEKTNGRIRFGISFGRADLNYAPTIYLEPFYRSFQRGNSIEHLAEELLVCYEEEANVMPEGIERLQDYEAARTSIFCKLLHLEENRHLLLDTPHIVFQDFAVVAYFEVNSADRHKGMVLIKNAFLEFWHITKEQFIENALQATREQKKLYFHAMSDFLQPALGEETAFIEQIRRGMFILTNEDRYLGSVLICFPEILERVAEKLQEDFYMLPSSVHEWIVIPVSLAREKEFLLEVVQDINRSEVSEEEVLSNNIYLYSIAAEGERISCITAK